MSKPKPQIIISKSQVGFLQDPPVLPSKFDSDSVLQSILQRYLPPEYYAAIKDELSQFGEFAVGELKAMGENAESNPPKLEQFDAWGHRIDKLITSEGWRKMHDVAALEGLVAIPYERRFKEYTRLYYFAKMYLFAPTSAVYSCPVSMSDGAARLIELYGSSRLKQEVYPRLISRDPKIFWTSGQWMTERPGGSDVGNTETIAEMGPDSQWRIYGFKWFSSATDADITMLLARAVDKDGNYTEGSKGLSLFCARVRDDNGKLNGIRMQKLKNKLGTRALPTAELELDGMIAEMVGEPGRGVATISTILNITRVHQAVGSAAGMRTCLQLVQDFARKRKTFGLQLEEHPLHIMTLSNMESMARASAEMAFHVAYLLGKSENGVATKADTSLLRLLTPLIKLFIAKQGIYLSSEAIEAVGGQGFIEDSGFPRALRDSQVGTIWEGTTNVLSLDILRVLAGNPEALSHFEELVKSSVVKAKGIPEIQENLQVILNALGVVSKYIAESLNDGWIQAGAKDLANTMARVYGGALLVEAVTWSKDKGQGAEALALNVWCENGIVVQSRVFPVRRDITAKDQRFAMSRSLL